MRHLDMHLYHDELITVLQILKIVDVRFYPKIFLVYVLGDQRQLIMVANSLFISHSWGYSCGLTNSTCIHAISSVPR